MTTEALPVVMSQASAASTSAPGVPPFWPVLSSPHSLGKPGSLGTCSARTTASGSNHATLALRPSQSLTASGPAPGA